MEINLIIVVGKINNFDSDLNFYNVTNTVNTFA